MTSVNHEMNESTLSTNSELILQGNKKWLLLFPYKKKILYVLFVLNGIFAVLSIKRKSIKIIASHFRLIHFKHAINRPIMNRMSDFKAKIYPSACPSGLQ